MSILDKMKVSVDSLSLTEKLIGSLQVTAFGLLVVFIGLGVLYACINIMNMLLNPEKKGRKVAAPVKVVETPVMEAEETLDETELVAVITAAIAATLQTSTHNIVVRNITRLPDNTPAWGRLGRVENINRW